ncbi:1,2-phenylacetyl-CoA epoxidase subunit B [Mycobacterium sp.]|uniref:1,2-phenylacetyl-CoA epoxidase subunit B n=1 Tax=Mycobacterium sp. TaxID=1785 RepID=UPI003BAA4934
MTIHDSLIQWEVFIRSRKGIAHQHVGAILAVSPEHAHYNARALYARRGEPASVWVVPSETIYNGETEKYESYFNNVRSKPFRNAGKYSPISTEERLSPGRDTAQ